MKKFFMSLILMLSIFSIVNAHPFKTEKELYNFYTQIDKEVDKELKKDYIKLFEQRKANLKEKASDDVTEKNLEDDEYLFTLKNGKLEIVFKKNILNGKFITLSRLYENGKKSRIACLSKENTAYYGTVKYFRENGTPLYSGQFYDGKMEGMYKEYYENGKILKESRFSNDKENGPEKSYYENGKISIIKNYKDGKANGEYIEYYPNGQLKLKGSYKNDLRNGEFKTYLINGKSAGSIFYKDGKEIKSTLTTYMKEDVFFNFPDKMEAQMNIGDEKSEALKKEMEEHGGYHMLGIDTYPNGRVMRVVPYNQQGQHDGEFLQYYESGQLAQKGTYKNGLGQGDYIWYHENGQIKQKSFYKDDKIEGTVSWFFPSGKIAQTANFKNGKEDGELIEYYENGQIKEKRFYINGKEEGKSLFYDEKGNLTKTEIYKDGIKQ
ncbi:toxin-antitoxin system YwqK family antitoxin [Fusobacterium simiae]|uniref:Toxin-antitoxin system YwqK family antitoxin n=2 Tax=Fusobacterium TaxID=848 RepID=A0ABT4DHR1_FUSSI|nr:toxin-antitoxin system YwqK family antitoxin [Fusobacterium simiae]MCY7008126.1 toxin-antitoxin system YwqK family antitoxin [Fusobacterium simiae]